MVGKKIYGESKFKTNLTLTKTALDWLEKMRVDLDANSLSDTIEKLARQKRDDR